VDSQKVDFQKAQGFAPLLLKVDFPKVAKWIFSKSIRFCSTFLKSGFSKKHYGF
jgi:hypothetical protein